MMVVALIGANAQTPIATGRGSYASSIPPELTEFWAGEKVGVKHWHESVPLHVVPGIKRPFPSNQWWSPLLFNDNLKTRYCIWAHPLNITVENYGVGFHFADSWSPPHGAYKETFFIENPKPLEVGGRDFAPVEQRVKGWGDWTVAFRVASSVSNYMDVTIGHGMPYAWFEYTGISYPRIRASDATFFDLHGRSVTLPFTGGSLGVMWEGRAYGLFVPDNTIFAMTNGFIELTMPTGKKFVAVAALPSIQRLDYYQRFAFAIPRDSRMQWRYDAEEGVLTTTWEVETAVLKGTERSIIQGWIPHHWRATRRDFEFNGDEYLTARGTMRCAAGTSFRIDYAFNGVLTHLPTPEDDSFDRHRMNNYLHAFAGWNHEFNPETYAGGKQVAMFARQLSCAGIMHHPKSAAMRAKLRGELEDFFTYTKGEPDKFFAYSERLGGLIGFQCGFGSHRFNDQHFHYGYYVYAAAMLSLYDKDFAANYGDMARLIAKTYANWDRNDGRFPFFRTFDIWEGHSWASGGSENSPWFGANQESSSEAMMSWAGVVTLGNALGDEAMTSAGIMGYVMEGAAANEYWFNRHGDNFPKNYGPPGAISCITWGNQIQYITYFGPEPVFVHGIQYLPILPSSYYLVRHPVAAAIEFDYMMTNSRSDYYTRFKTRDSWEGLWAAEAMRYASLFNPAWASEWFEELWQKKDPRANDPWESGLTYYFIEANKKLGAIQWNAYIATPDSAVFYNPDLDRHTYCAFNPTEMPQAYNVYRDGKIIGTLKVPANSFFSTHELDGNLPPSVSLEAPIDGIITRVPHITLGAHATDPDGSIVRVDFFEGHKLIGTVNHPPYTMTVGQLKDGPHAFAAKAYDNQGLTAYSPYISVTCDLPAKDILLPAMTVDFSAKMTGKANPVITFIPEKPIAGCAYVDILVKRNGQDAGAFRMTKSGNEFTKQINADIGDNIECSFTYQTPPAGERNTHATPCAAIVGGP